MTHPDTAHIENTPHIPVPEGFAVTPSVWDAVRRLPCPGRMDGPGEYHRVCHLCGQSVAHLVRGGIDFRYTPDQKDGMTLSHMIQTHNWTRETVGEW